MFGSRVRKVFRDLRARKGRTALVSLAIFMGVLGVLMFVAGGDIIVNQLRTDMNPEQLAMIRAFVSLPSGTEVDNTAYLEGLRELPAVTHVQGNANYPIAWKLPGEDEFTAGYIRAFSEPFGEIPMEPPRLTAAGRNPEPGRKEVAIERRMADEYGLKVGDQLVLRVLGGAAGGAAGEGTVREETWTIAGVLFHPFTYFTAVGFIPNDTSVYATYEDAQYIAAFSGFSSIYARYVDYPAAQREADSFLTFVGENTPYKVTFNYMEAPADNVFIRMTRKYTDLFGWMGILALIVSGFLVTNIISAIILEQNRQIGVMKSLGATRMDSFLMYAGIALAYGLIGTLPGILLGIPFGAGFATGMSQNLPFVLVEGMGISLRAIIVGLAMGLLVPVLAAIIPIYNGTKVTILEAMTDLGISTGSGVGRATRVLRALPLPVNVRQAVSNVIRKRGRNALTVATLMSAIAVFMATFAVMLNLLEAIRRSDEAAGYHIQVIPNEIQSYDEMQSLIVDNVAGVRAVNPSVSVSLQVEGYEDPTLRGDQLAVEGFDPGTDSFRLDLKGGTAWQDDPEREGIVLSSSVAKQLDKRTGDTLVTSIGGKTIELEVIGVDRYPFDLALMEWRALARLAGVTVGAPTPNEYTVLVQVEGYAGTLPGGQAAAVGFDEQVGAFLSFEDGAFFAPGEPGVIVSADMAAKGGYGVGDRLTLSVGESAATHPIVGIFNLPPGAVSEGQPTDVIGFHWEALAALEGRDVGGEPAPNALLIQMEDADPTSDHIDDVIKDLSDVLAGQGITADFINQVAEAEGSLQELLPLLMIFAMACLIMAVVGAIGLLATLSMAVFERQREIGVMRSIGAGSLTVAGQFLVEGILLGLIAWIVGVPLSYLVSLGLMKLLPFGFLDFTYSPICLVLGLIGILVIATVASVWPSLGAARKTVAQIIRYQ